MTTFWCLWCGTTTERPDPGRTVPCIRCANEFFHLFGFVPRTDMLPLDGSTAPGPPWSARKQFVFHDAQSGAEIGRTRVPPATSEGRERRRSAS